MLQPRPEPLTEAPPLDPEVVRAENEAAQREMDFWVEHWQEFLEKYPNLFVAVRDGEVIATDPDLFAICATLEQMGIEPGAVWMEYLDTDPGRLRL